MRINVLQHTPNEGAGSIETWANQHGHEMYVYHPYQYGLLPSAEDTDLLIILGGPMNPNDPLPWLAEERSLIADLIARHVPMFGACLGAQQIVKTLGYQVLTAPEKEVGWAPIYRQSNAISDLPEQLTALHWHQDMFEIPDEAQCLFSSDHLQNQGFVLGQRIVGLQCHLEPEANNVREMVVNDGGYTDGSVLGQSPADILAQPVPSANKQAMFRILDYLTQNLVFSK